MVSIFVKSYQELSKLELYKILRLRAEVFVVEQDCVYQDIDNKDQKALHVFLIKSWTQLWKKERSVNFQI
jgi:ElaA protein